MGTNRWALLLIGLGLTGCPRPGPAVAPSDGAVTCACPPAEGIEDLHAAAFYFERGDATTGQERLRRARERLGAFGGESDALIAALGEIEALAGGGPERLRSAAEIVRARLQDWRCLTPELHQQVHSRLPSVR